MGTENNVAEKLHLQITTILVTIWLCQHERELKIESLTLKKFL